MFLLKKMITACLLPPGIIILLVLFSVLLVRKRLRLFLVCLAGVIYVISIGPTRDFFLAPLEKAFPIPPMEQVKKAGAYVWLGGGALDNALDMDGKGMLTGESLLRLVAAYKLYRIERKPIVVSAGAVFNKVPESEIARKFLLQLGVPAEDVMTETTSRDTLENARFTAEICKKKGLKRIVLVTSAFHMKRSVLLFRKFFEEITPYPAAYHAEGPPYNYLSFVPSANNMADISLALKEYMGIVFYRWVSSP